MERRLAVLGRFDVEAEARVLVAGLERERIEAFVSREEGQIVVRVHEIDLRPVLALPIVRRTPEMATETLEAFAETCPECGSTAVHTTPRLAIFVLGVVSLIGLGAAIGQSMAIALLLPCLAFTAFLLDTRKCESCQFRWTPEPEEPEEGDRASRDEGPEIEYIPPDERVN